MLVFNKLEEKRVYRVKDKITVPFDKESLNKGNLLMVFGENISDTINFFKNPYIKLKYYQRYYIDKKLRYTIINTKFIKTNKQDEIFEEGFGKYYPSFRLYRLPSAVSQFNAIYELGQIEDIVYTNEKIQAKPFLKRAEIQFNMIVDKLKTISSEFPDHKKFIYFPIHEYIENPRSTAIWTNRKFMENHLISFIRLMLQNPQMIKSELSDYTFIFSNMNEMFYINATSFDSNTGDMFKLLFKKFRSKKSSVDITEVDDENLKDTDSPIEDENDIISSNIKISKEIKSNIINNIDNAESVPKELKSSIKKDIVSSIDNKVKDNTKEITKIEVNNEIIKTKEKDKTNLAKTNLITNNIEEIKENNKQNVAISDNKILTKEELLDDSKKVTKKKINDYLNPGGPRLARINKIKNDMSKLEVDNKPISKILEDSNSKMVENHKIDVNIINDDLKQNKFDNFEEGYNKNLLESDLLNILTSFSEKDRPLYMISINKEDSSTSTDQLYTYKMVFEDETGKRHHITLDVPKFVDNKFMHLNGSDKLFINQIIPLPVTKVSKDEVQVSSNYNKIFINRFGKNVSSKVAKFHKFISEADPKIIRYETGNNIQNNTEYMTTIEYDELSSKYNKIELRRNNITLYFNQEEIQKICESNNLTYNRNNSIPFGIERLENGDLNLITIYVPTDKIEDQSPIDYIINQLSIYQKDIKNQFGKYKASKKNMYTRATIMAKKVPIVLLLSFLTGLEPLLNRMNVNYHFSETRPTEKSLNNETVITFKDGYLVYDNSEFKNALILNGLYDMPTEEYEFIQFSTKDIYYDIFVQMFGRRNIGSAFENFEQLFIDPITKEILEDYNLPTNFIDLILFANSLLDNNTYDKEGELHNFRLRSNELINAHIYKILTNAYEKYRVTADYKNPTPFSVKRDAVIKDIYESQIMEEYSTLNPIFEIDRMRATSFKGPGGCNVDNAFSIAKRAYNDSMLGVFSQSSPVSSNIGISRVLSLNPNIKSLRGYIEPGDKNKLDKLNESNMLSGAELLVPFTATHDDPLRVSMASTQSRHTISTKESDRPLFGYGMDKVLPKVISNRFAYKAKDDGIITEINEDLNYMMISYNNGKTDIVDLSHKPALNTGSGFYIDNKLSPIFELGYKFKKDEIIAINKDFFDYDSYDHDVVYKSGPLARVAVMHGSFVYEDSTIVTKRLSERMSSKITECKEIRLGKNSNIYDIVKLGDEVKVGDPLIIFDESYTDDYLNKVLEKMNDETKEDLIEAGRTPVKSKINGKILAIKIYYTVDKEELSDSLKSIVSDYEKKINKRLKNFKSNGINLKDLTSLNETAEKTVPINDKIEGTKMDGNHVLIKFYIETEDKFSVGDKLTFACALKGINQDLIPLGQEPYIASDPEEKIDAIMAASGYYARMTNSFALSLALNTLMLGTEKKIKEILDS